MARVDRYDKAAGVARKRRPFAAGQGTREEEHEAEKDNRRA
jgi:hypothetical protein